MLLRMSKQPARVTLKTAQIGRCGELMVQFRLLMLGIDSAPMSTDSGIDLVAYPPKAASATTIQVKTNLKPKPSGGRGKDTLDWRVAEDTPAQLITLVDLSTQREWVFQAEEVKALAQQHSGGQHHLYMVVDPTFRPTKPDRLSRSYEFERYLLENRARELFGA